MALALTLSSDQRTAFIGQTRMGKTFLVRLLAKRQTRVIVVDSKHDVVWPGFHLTDSPVAALLADRVIYRPPAGTPPDGFWMAAVRSLHKRGGGVLIVDEGAYVTTASVIPRGLADAYRTGGGLGVGVWLLCQESTTVHNTVLRQSEVIVMFYNQGTSDREKLAGIVGDMAYCLEYLDRYEFIVFVRGDTYDHDAVPVYTVDT